MLINWDVVATGLVAPLSVLVVNYLLDLTLACWIVKYFWWLPVRKVMRDKPPLLAGQWEQVWSSGGSVSFSLENDRHSYLEMRQFGRYLYAEYHAKRRTYFFFGRIKGHYVVGSWSDREDELGYFGAVQLRISNSDLLEGMYVGHSNKTGSVGAAEWRWSRVA